jgi:hypothetical protein
MPVGKLRDRHFLGLAMVVLRLRWSDSHRPDLGLLISAAAGPREEVRGVLGDDLGEGARCRIDPRLVWTGG